ncbi:MAG: lipopolysaccharide heptosyltransferase I [Sulfuritalea sp.]|nr:lipopolysaccharide heptosyltransferase I [Sulfuritalea sp.]
MRILLIKTSSLGDVIHNLPVVTDLRAQFPDAAIDWVVEEGFADIVGMHPGVRRAVPVALRRWRKSLFSPTTWREMRDFRAGLRAEDHDLVIDTQGLLKSALIARSARGRRCGYAAASAREPLAARFYDTVFEVPKNLHAVERNLHLAALAAGYTAAPIANYGIAAAPAPTPVGPSAILLTATSRDDKLWPEEHWIRVGRALHQRGLTCLLPSGSADERARAERLAQAIPAAVALAPLSLAEVAAHIAAARIVIGVDTGLVHLAAALGRPVLALFCASDPALTGVYATTPAINLGARGRPPAAEDVLTAALPLL